MIAIRNPIYLFCNNTEKNPGGCSQNLIPQHFFFFDKTSHNTPKRKKK